MHSFSRVTIILVCSWRMQGNARDVRVCVCGGGVLRVVGRGQCYWIKQGRCYGEVSVGVCGMTVYDMGVHTGQGCAWVYGGGGGGVNWGGQQALPLRN